MAHTVRCAHCRIHFLRFDDYLTHGCANTSLPPRGDVEPPTVLLERLRASIADHPAGGSPWDK
jgi:hypothetical protein